MSGNDVSGAASVGHISQRVVSGASGLCLHVAVGKINVQVCAQGWQSQLFGQVGDKLCVRFSVLTQMVLCVANGQVQAPPPPSAQSSQRTQQRNGVGPAAGGDDQLVVAVGQSVFEPTAVTQRVCDGFDEWMVVGHHDLGWHLLIILRRAVTAIVGDPTAYRLMALKRQGDAMVMAKVK